MIKGEIYLIIEPKKMCSIVMSSPIAVTENISKMYKYIQCNTSKAFYFHAC